VANSFFSIATTTVGAGNASNIEFTNIPQTYTHLQIRGILRNTTAIANNRIQFNSDTGANYSWHELYGDGASAGSGASSGASYMYAGNHPTTSSTFAVYVIDILDYRDTNKFKTVRTLSGYDLNGSGVVGLRSGNWRSTSAITSIKLYPGSDSFAQYSSFALYGVLA
jgi:hypothetical protein